MIVILVFESWEIKGKKEGKKGKKKKGEKWGLRNKEKKTQKRNSSSIFLSYVDNWFARGGVLPYLGCQ